MDRKFNILTGEKGADRFDAAMIITRCKDYYQDTPFVDIAKEYLDCREKLFDLNRKYNQLRKNKIVKLLIKLKVVKP